MDQLNTSFNERFWNRDYERASTLLVKNTSSIGDALYMTAIIAEIKRKYPRLRIFLTKNHVVDAIFHNHHAVTALVPDSATASSLPKIDITIDYNNVIIKLPEYFNGLSFMDIMGNIAAIKLENRDIIYTVEASEKEWAENEVKAFGPCLKIGVQFSTNRDARRCYPYGNELIKILKEQYAYVQFVVFGNEPINISDLSIYDCAMQRIPFRKQVALSYHCDAFITIDSAFFHIGHNLCRKPTLLICGLTNPELIGNPAAKCFVPVRNEKLSCLSCYWKIPCNAECMYNLSPEVVVDAFKKMMNHQTLHKIRHIKKIVNDVLSKHIEQIACPYCDSARAVSYRNIADIVKCTQCNTVYLRTRLTKAAMMALYQKYADGESHMALPKNKEMIQHSVLRRDYFLSEILEFTNPDGILLDIGCGWGAFLDNARARNFTPLGIEINKKCIDFANNILGIPVVNKDITGLDYLPNSISVITMIHSLEHIPDPRNALQNIFSMLQPHGMLCGIVPNIESFCSRLLKDKWEWIDPFHHYVHYAPETLRKHLEDIGFIIERMYTTTGDYNQNAIESILQPKHNMPSTDEAYKNIIKSLELSGKGEEIRFFARKPQTQSLHCLKWEPSLETVEIEISPNENYEQTIIDNITNRKKPVRLILYDPHNALPEYAEEWNGVVVKRNSSIIPLGKPGIIWEGSQFVTHSLALINRELCLQLINDSHEVSIIPYEPDQFGVEADPRFKKLAVRINRPLTGKVDVHVRHQWPPNLTSPSEGRWVIIQPWEFGSLPEEWVRIFSAQVDEMWVPSNYVRQVYIDSGIPAERVVVIPNGINPEKFHSGVKPYRLKTQKKFKFLFVGGTIHRKGIDLLLQAYLDTFKRSDDVCLVIKDMGGNSFYAGQTFKEKIERIQQNNDLPEVEYIDQILSEKELIGLYTASNVLVHPYRGEGFGLPILEAMACGIPAIVTNGGACLDFCNDKNSLLVNATKKFFWQKFVGDIRTVDYPWLFEVDMKDLKAKMRYAYEHPEKMQLMGKEISPDIRNNWTWEKSANRIKERVQYLRKAPVLRRIKDNLYIHRPDTSKGTELLNRADELFRTGAYREAIDAYKKAIECNPAFFDSYYNLGLVYASINQPDEAISALEKAIELNNKEASAFNNLGVLYFRKKMYNDARSCFEKALAIDANYAEAQQNLEKISNLKNS